MRPWLTLWCFASLLVAVTVRPASLEIPLRQGPIQLERGAADTLMTPKSESPLAQRMTVPLSGNLGMDFAAPSIDGSLTLQPGPSFLADSRTVVSWIAAFEGELVIHRGEKTKVWRMRQYNFLNQAARANYNTATARIAFLLPTLLSADGEPDVHAFLRVTGRIEGTTLVLTTLSFPFESMTTRAFPTSPTANHLFLIWHPGGEGLTDDRDPDRIGMPCCMGAWCCQCGRISCQNTICPLACQDCYENACRECETSECPFCCNPP